jgi:hypothetical protein
VITAALQQTEAQFQTAVIDLARIHGWLIAHFHDSRRQLGGKLVGDADAAGWPDLTLVRGPELLLAELKTEKGRIKPTQLVWMEALLEVARCSEYVHVRLWRPSDWSEIEAMLR